VALPGAVNYDVWIDNVSTNQSQFVRDMNVAGTSFTPPSDLPMGSYRAWVRGTNASGSAAAWAVPVDFQVLLPVTVPAAGPSTFDLTPTFTWNAVPGAVGYDLVVRNANTGVTVLVSTGIMGTSFTPVTNLPVDQYRWQVFAVAPSGLKSQSATTQHLYVGGRLTLLTPSGSTPDTTPTFTWTPVTESATYEVFVTRTDVLTGGIIHSTGLVGTSFTPVTPLPIGNYRAWVRAISTTAEAGPWSLQVHFSIAAITDEPGFTTGDVLLTQLTLLEVDSLEANSKPSTPVPANASGSAENFETLPEIEPGTNAEASVPVAAPVRPRVKHPQFLPVWSLLVAEGGDAIVDAVMADLTADDLLVQI